MDSRVPEILEKAADLLESGQVQWTQDDGYVQGNEDGYIRACALGAVYLAGEVVEKRQTADGIDLIVGNMWSDHPCVVVEDLLRKRVPLHSNGNYGTVESWNDDSQRRLSEVVDLMKATAKDVRNGEVA